MNVFNKYFGVFLFQQLIDLSVKVRNLLFKEQLDFKFKQLTFSKIL